MSAAIAGRRASAGEEPAMVFGGRAPEPSNGMSAGATA